MPRRAVRCTKLLLYSMLFTIAKRTLVIILFSRLFQWPPLSHTLAPYPNTIISWYTCRTRLFFYPYATVATTMYIISKRLYREQRLNLSLIQMFTLPELSNKNSSGNDPAMLAESLLTVLTCITFQPTENTFKYTLSIFSC